ncbi:hypothetical protein V4_0633 [Lactococcus cremoris]|nr:hypothetical protein V4_0633 [Lactococcus cremoris]
MKQLISEIQIALLYLDKMMLSSILTSQTYPKNHFPIT